ncbi:Protease HtpX [Candidatus Lokiarchaeum ossiferum]|uniref:Protease HtpX n=1 Tax=Candidatus Lokiarchaeum ossiferum TaxID=2951803 RepID=A0ABY6HUX0_9ARCH|nr:Protease HtpX [Candidatus Lokiarchaeum sp. B-35]
MKKRNQMLILLTFILGTLSIILPLFLLQVIKIPTKPLDIALWAGFGIMWIVMINEGLNWIKNGKRSEWSDLVVIIFLFITVYLASKNLFNSFIGAFSIYLIFGVYEMKDYEILNKVVLITVITYNMIFFAGIIGDILQANGLIEDGEVWLNTAFSLSFWVMLILGFAFFGRKYMVVFRFMSPTYLTLAVYLVAWGLIVTVAKLGPQELEDIIMNSIYFALIISNIVIYVFSGPLLDLLMGYKKTDDPRLVKIVEETAIKMKMDPKKIKIRYAKYPILNAMAYGAFFNMHMAIISPEIDTIPEDELKGVVAHELGHLKGLHTFWLNIISSIQILIFYFLKWPVTMYDYTFAPDSQPFPLWVFLLLNVVMSVFIYIFVRDFEAHADKAARDAGYAHELAKGLYNLESFYATSHEIGLDATLLSNEIETENNKMLNYISTASYLNKNLINPNKGTLLSNLINSHPPSYHRIMASYNETPISCMRESLMPFTFLKKYKANQFLIETEHARQKYIQMTTEKVKKRFKITDVKDIMTILKKKEELSFKIGQTYVYQNLITKKRIFGRIEDIEYVDSITEPIRYKVKVLQGDETKEFITINPSQNLEVSVNIGEIYPYRKEESLLKLKEIRLEEVYQKSEKKPKKENPSYLFLNTGVLVFERLGDQESEVKKSIFNEIVPKSYQYIEQFKEKDIFMKEKGSFKRMILENYELNENKEFVLQLKDPESNSTFEAKKEDYIFKYSELYFPIHNDETSFESERKFIQHLQEQQIRCYVILKKAVNAEIDAFITKIEFKIDEKSEIEQIHKIWVKSIFEEEMELEISKIDVIGLISPNLILQKKSNISGFSNLINKIIQWRHPEKILI